MRIPLARVYRAFPEFDDFSDEDCSRYVAAVERDWKYRGRCALVLLGMAALWAPLFATMLAMKPVVRSINPAVAAVVGLAALVIWVAISLSARDWVLRNAIAARLIAAKCPGCSYSLLGLDVVDGAAICPECGRHIILADHHITPADLLVHDRKTDPLPQGST